MYYGCVPGVSQQRHRRSMGAAVVVAMTSYPQERAVAVAAHHDRSTCCVRVSAYLRSMRSALHRRYPSWAVPAAVAMVLASYVTAFRASKCFPTMTELDRTDSVSYKCCYRHKRADTLTADSAVTLERSHRRHQRSRPDSCDAIQSNSDVVVACRSDHRLPCYCTLNLHCLALSLACDRLHCSA